MRAPLRVLLITGSLGPGGTELSVEALARGLAASGAARPHVALLGEGGTRADRLRAAGVPVTELRLSGRLWRPDNAVRLLRLAGIVRRESIDVVHTFLFDADVYGMLAARLGRPRAVVTTRRAIKRNRPHHIRGYRLTNRFADRIVANSEAVCRFTLERERVPPEKLVVIPNGVDTTRMASGDRAAFRREHGIPPDAVVVGTAGTVKPVKGQAVLVRAMEPLLAEDPRRLLILAGTAAGPYAERIRRQAASGPLAGRVRLAGNVEDIPGLLAALDLFVLPSLSEGMSNALLEAMAAGCAVVATDVGGNRECLGDTGVLVPAGDAVALREAIEELLGDEERRRHLGRRARERAARHFAIEAMVARTADLYRSLLKEGRRA
ncbi:MAG: glycosyltransferase [Acidobacteria bacterium]|nr:MAG: glycosyltransferase [Acidobacteriota bacterium]